MDEVNETPHVSWWAIMLMNWQSRLWALQHWIVTHLCSLTFCHSCSGYFREACMTLPDKCEACYARDYAVPAPVPSIQYVPSFTWYPKCGQCGLNHSPNMHCAPMPGGGYWLTWPR